MWTLTTGNYWTLIDSTEYEQFHGKPIEVAMPSARPSEFALKRRHEKFLEAEQGR